MSVLGRVARVACGRWRWSPLFVLTARRAWRRGRVPEPRRRGARAGARGPRTSSGIVRRRAPASSPRSTSRRAWLAPPPSRARVPRPAPAALGRRRPARLARVRGAAARPGRTGAGGRTAAALMRPSPDDVAAAEPGDTDLAAALASASALCPQDRQTALLLFTDGNETRGSVRRAAIAGRPGLSDRAAAGGAARRDAPPRCSPRSLAPERTFVPLEVGRRGAPGDVARRSHSRSTARALTPRPLDLRAGRERRRAAVSAAEGVRTHALEARLLARGGRAAVAARRRGDRGGHAAGARALRDRARGAAGRRARRSRGAASTSRSCRRPRSPARSAHARRRITSSCSTTSRARGSPTARSRRSPAGWRAAAALIVTGGAHLFGDPGLRRRARSSASCRSSCQSQSPSRRSASRSRSTC